jgi:hypothetical protein
MVPIATPGLSLTTTWSAGGSGNWAFLALTFPDDATTKANNAIKLIRTWYRGKFDLCMATSEQYRLVSKRL